MYGSQYEAQQVLTILRPSTQKLALMINSNEKFMPLKITKIFLNFSFIIFIFFLFSSCSTTPYSTEKNCSERGLKVLLGGNSSTEKEILISAENSSDMITDSRASLRKLFQDHASDFKSCYQEYLDSNSDSRNKYAVCTILTVNDGKLTFLDIDDKENGLDSELKKCLEAKFNSLDFTPIQDGKNYIIQQPLNLYPKEK